MEENTVRFYFKKKSQLGSYTFVRTSADSQSEDEIVIYLLADTGSDGVRAADLSFQYDTDAMFLLGVDTVGSIFPYAYGAYGLDGNGSIRMVVAADAPVVGTRGYVAALRFRPLREGDTSLTFLSVDAVGGERPGPVASRADGLTGLFSRTTVSEEIPVVANPTVVPVGDGEYVCPCLRERFFPLCLVLLCTLILSLLALVLLWAHARSRERRNDPVPDPDKTIPDANPNDQW